MPIKKSAAKALRQSKKRAKRNEKVKANIDWLKRQFLKAIRSNSKKQASDLFVKLQKAFDKAFQKNVFKKNTVARNKSRLFKKMKALK